MIQKGRYQRFSIVLPLFVEARGKGHQIAVVGSSVSLGYLFYLDIETYQPDHSSDAELVKHFRSACFHIIEQARFFAFGRDIDQYGIGVLAVGYADGIVGEKSQRNLPKQTHQVMVVCSAANVLEHVVLAETIRKRGGKTFDVFVLHDVTLLQGRDRMDVHWYLLFCKNSKLPLKNKAPEEF